jgi:hypothetical protein
MVGRLAEVQPMTHDTEVKRFPGTLTDLAEAVGDLRYDALAAFLMLLQGKLDRDAGQDESRGRVRLAASLRAATCPLGEAAAEVQRAWRICEPRMAGEGA